MKNRLGGLFVAAVLIAILAMIWIFDRPTAAVAEEAPVPAAAERVLGVWEGRLALFENNAELPQQVYEVWIATLPETEQQKLTAGIAITDDQALWSLLEDYTG